MSSWNEADCRAIEEAVSERAEGLLKPGERLEVSGISEPDHVQARFVVHGGPDGEHLEMESRVEIGRSVKQADQARDLTVDALDMLLLEYLESERSIRFSGVWEERALRGKPVAVRLERTFPDLDAQADALLRGSDESEPQ